MTSDAPRQALLLDELRRKVRALVLFRVVVVSFLLAATALLGAVGAAEQPNAAGTTEALIYGLVGVVYVLSIGYAIALRLLTGEPALVRLAYLQLAGDALFAATLVLITGGTSSVFTFFFSLSIVLAAVILYRHGALAIATLSGLLLVGIGLVELGVVTGDGLFGELRRLLFGDIQPLSADEQAANYGAVVTNLVVNVVAFYAVALLASWLADQLRRTDLRLEQNRASLEDLRALHENIVSSIQSGLITVNRSRQITYFNDVAEQITGYEAADVLYQDITRYFADLRAIFLNEDKLESQHSELTSQVLGGALAYIRWTISPLTDSRERRIGHILTFEDVTRVRQMEEQMKKAETLATLGKLAAGIAHEIRNPLASISGAIQLLGATLDLDADSRRLMDIVTRETDSLNHWITDFLTYARPRMGQPIPVDLAQLLGDAVTVLKHDEKSANIQVELDTREEASVLADPTYLKQVVWNVLHNAVQAMPDGGKLAVAVREHSDGRGEFYRATFRDTGGGIPPELQSRVFEPFFTTKDSGTGLGLATVHRIVSEHGGFVSVDSTRGVGTTFTIDLPRHHQGA